VLLLVTHPDRELTDVGTGTHEIGRWRENGEIAYERDFALRLTLGDDRIVRIVVMPGDAPPP
jgi:hypothetical protein